MTSAAETPSSGWISTGMPRPSSVTVMDSIGVDGDRDVGAVTRQRFVDGVVDDLEDHVVQAGAVIGVADVHAGALSDRVEAL